MCIRSVRRLGRKRQNAAMRFTLTPVRVGLVLLVLPTVSLLVLATIGVGTRPSYQLLISWPAILLCGIGLCLFIPGRVSTAVLATFAIVVSLISLVITFPWAVYLSKWSSCGHQPVKVSGFAASNSYSLPGDPTYAPDIFSGYVCTEDEAVRNGYHRIK